MNITFKSAQNEENKIAAAAVVECHMKWFKAVLADTFEGFDDTELTEDDVYNNYMREPEIIIETVKTLTAEAVIAFGDCFELKIGRAARAIGYNDFDSLVDAASKRNPRIRALL